MPIRRLGAKPAQLKPVLQGLADRQGIPSGNWSGSPTTNIVKSCVLKINWEDIETSNNVFSWTTIDGFLDDLIPFGGRMRLRCYCGMATPAHVRNDGANTSQIAWQDDGDWQSTTPANPDYYTNGQFNVPMWWGKSAYWEYYYRLMSKIAERYDNDDRMADVVISMCGTIFAEPMIKQKQAKIDGVKVNENAAASQVPAWSKTLEDTAMKTSFEIHNEVFKRTRSYLACNRFQDLTTAVTDGPAEAYATQARQILGAKLIIGQNSIREGGQSGYEPLLTHITDVVGPPISFQTQPVGALPINVGDLQTTVQWAVDNGASLVELPQGYQGEMTASVGATLDAALRANSTKTFN